MILLQRPNIVNQLTILTAAIEEIHLQGIKDGHLKLIALNDLRQGRLHPVKKTRSSTSGNNLHFYPPRKVTNTKKVAATTMPAPDIVTKNIHTIPINQKKSSKDEMNMIPNIKVSIDPIKMRTNMTGK